MARPLATLRGSTQQPRRCCKAFGEQLQRGAQGTRERHWPQLMFGEAERAQGEGTVVGAGQGGAAAVRNGAEQCRVLGLGRRPPRSRARGCGVERGEGPWCSRPSRGGRPHITMAPPALAAPGPNAWPAPGPRLQEGAGSSGSPPSLTQPRFLHTGEWETSVRGGEGCVYSPTAWANPGQARPSTRAWQQQGPCSWSACQATPRPAPTWWAPAAPAAPPRTRAGSRGTRWSRGPGTPAGHRWRRRCGPAGWVAIGAD
jgi:hypothetical protein